jgi:hypothetical protein
VPYYATHDDDDDDIIRKEDIVISDPFLKKFMQILLLS